MNYKFVKKAQEEVKDRLLNIQGFSKRHIRRIHIAILIGLNKTNLSIFTTFRPERITQTAINFLSNYATTLFGIIISIGLYTPTAQRALSKFDGIDNIFLASAGLLGTFLAIVPTLAIIPIQRSVEVFGSSITRLYMRDRVTQIIIISVGGMCILSFLMPIGIISQLSKASLLPIQILFICISLDLLRLHQRRVTNFLGPRQAINSLMKEIINHIQSVQKRISRISIIQIKLISLRTTQEIPSQSEIENFHYQSIDKYHHWLKKSIDELFEIGTKAIMRGDITTARLVVVSIKQIVIEYVHSRKSNVTIYHEANMVFSSQINMVIEPIFQRLEIMNTIALTNKMEFISLSIFENSSDIINYINQSSDEHSHPNLSSTIWLPLGFYKNCLEFSIKINSDEITLQSIRILTNLVLSSPNDTRHDDLYHSCINMLDNTAHSFLQKNNGTLVNETVKEMLKIAYHVLSTNHFQLDNVISLILKSIENMLPISLLLEKNSSHFSIPSLTAYDLTNNISLGYLVQFSFRLTKPINDDQTWLNPYNEVIRVNKLFYRHFREIADSLQFNDSWFLWNICQTLKHIAHVYLSEIQNPITTNEDHIKELASQLQWFLSFFWSSFKIQTNISINKAEHACDTLAWIGLASIEVKQFDIAISCASNISSIITSYLKLGKSSSRKIANMYMNIWYLILIAEKQNYLSIIPELNKYSSKSDHITEDDWGTIQEYLKSDKDEMVDYLNDAFQHRHELDDLKIILSRLYYIRTTD